MNNKTLLLGIRRASRLVLGGGTATGAQDAVGRCGAWGWEMGHAGNGRCLSRGGGEGNWEKVSVIGRGGGLAKQSSCIVFLLIVCAFGVLFRKHFPISRSQSFSTTSSFYRRISEIRWVQLQIIAIKRILQ